MTATHASHTVGMDVGATVTQLAAMAHAVEVVVLERAATNDASRPPASTPEEPPR